MSKRVPEGRPNRFSKEVVAKTARKIALDLSTLPDSEEFGEEVEKDVAEAIHRACTIDAYKVCKQLEYLGWEIDEELVDEIRSHAYTHQIKATNEATKQWIEDNNYELRFEVGDTVKFTHPRGHEEFGEITKVFPELLRYVIYCEHLGHIPEGKGAGTHGIIINDEKVIDYVSI